MKVLLVNGSPNGHGCTYTALKEIEKTLRAEGVETEKQFEYIRRMGVDVVQGYLMSKPVPKAELEKLIQHEESYL